MSEALNQNYEICEEIGRGRFGVVYRCVSSASGHTFACKSIDKRLIANDSIDRECLIKEPKFNQIVAGSPYIVELHDVFEDSDHLHLILEFCGYQTLYEQILAGTFSEKEAAAVMEQLVQAVAHCHRRGIAHRDIKPDNVLFDDRNRLKLGDFGSAEWFGNGETMSGLVGTPYYVAPEVVSGREYTEKVDVWSCGVILYIMLAGIPPFYGESATEIFQAVLRGNLRFPTRPFHSVSPAAKDLLKKMLCKDVSRRLSADQVLRHPWMMSGGDLRSMTN
uniref:Phosphoenolpyruvate carboxylase kinase n=1 Tax=Kalanchoe pinnata TaxID=80913 RepID=B2WR83_KALPI|nr:phosphoenolpyruvate carboxylase kinase [Kalanchoe pinnata]